MYACTVQDMRERAETTVLGDAPAVLYLLVLLLPAWSVRQITSSLAPAHHLDQVCYGFFYGVDVGSTQPKMSKKKLNNYGVQLT